MSTAAPRRFDLVITDLDNTLYDWEAFFIPSFRAMLSEVKRISGVGADELEASFQRVYQGHRTTEYAFAIEELDALAALEHVSACEIRLKYAPAIEAFRATRDRTLRLYPSVHQTLERLRAAGVRIVAHSDSVIGYVSRRLRQLDIDTLFDAVSAPSDHALPAYVPPNRTRDTSGMARTRHVEFSPSLRKPDPGTLSPLLDSLGVPRNRSVYVGDNLSRDMTLATRAGIASVWARYGAVHDPELRKQLLRITYWTKEDVEAEARLRKDSRLAQPTFVIDSYSEMIAVVGIATADERGPQYLLRPESPPA